MLLRCFAMGVGFGVTCSMAVTRYVDLNSPNPMPPYTDWSIAATNIQDAIDVAVAGEDVVVTNGVYATGGKTVSGSMTNRVALDKPVTVSSVNGPSFTTITGFQLLGTTNGVGAIRCAYLVDGATLKGFTLTGGATETAAINWGGGGVWCQSTNAFVLNCVIRGNSSSAWGGGGILGHARKLSNR